MRDFEATVRLCLQTRDKTFTISCTSAGMVVIFLSKINSFHVWDLKGADEFTHAGRGIGYCGDTGPWQSGH